MNIGSLRQNYTENLPLHRHELKDDPFEQFEAWFQKACTSNVPEPNAMVLTTVVNNQPSLRTVLLKLFDTDGFVFFTNYASRKAQEVSQNDRVALLFPWYTLHQQVIVSGIAERISATDSLRYFSTRPRNSQLGAWCSRQSSVLSSRSILEAKLDEIKRKFANGAVPLPSFWGGYRVIPNSIEFWQGQADRLHDRFLYSRQDAGGWKIERLAP